MHIVMDVITKVPKYVSSILIQGFNSITPRCNIIISILHKADNFQF